MSLNKRDRLYLKLDHLGGDSTFDVSGSMSSIISSLDDNKIITLILQVEGLQNLIAVDHEIKGTYSASNKGFQELVKTRGSFTELKKAVEFLLVTNASILIITDNEGLETLHGLNVVEHEYQKYAPKELKVVYVDKAV